MAPKEAILGKKITIGPGMSPVLEFKAEELGLVDRLILNTRGGLAGGRVILYGFFDKAKDGAVKRDDIFGFPIFKHHVNPQARTINGADVHEHIPGFGVLYKLTIKHQNHNFLEKGQQVGTCVEFVVFPPGTLVQTDRGVTNYVLCMHTFDKEGGKQAKKELC